MSDAISLSCLGSHLRELRLARGLSIAQAAAIGGISKSALAHWEAGRRTPAAEPLAQVLHALKVPARTCHRLLALCDPQGARIVLANSPLGAPVALGELLRAMRIRRGMRQLDLGRSVGRSQATVARWERGDDLPDATTLQTVFFVLGASSEEMAAAVSPDATRQPSHDLEERYAAIAGGPHALSETLWIGFEAELWWRAAASPNLEPMLQAVVNNRIDWYTYSLRPREVEPLVERALRLGHGPSDHRPHGLTFGLVFATLQMRADVRPALRRLDQWEERLTTASARASTRALGALLVAERDKAQAIALGRHAQRLAVDDRIVHAWATHSIARVHLRHDEPEQALEILDGEEGIEASMVRALALARLGRSPSESEMTTIRNHRATREVPMYRERLAEIERALRKGRRKPVARQSQRAA